MEKLCACSSLRELKIEGDYGADALWCDVCGYNLDLAEIDISPSLKEAFYDWAHAYGEWMDEDTETPKSNAHEEVARHNETGQMLMKALEKELPNYEIFFKRATVQSF